MSRGLGDVYKRQGLAIEFLYCVKLTIQGHFPEFPSLYGSLLVIVNPEIWKVDMEEWPSLLSKGQ